jgi:large subunit ribosomal protein L18
MINKPVKNDVRTKVHGKIRNKISGTPEIPRLNVFRSNKHMYAQLIDDVNGCTLASASTLTMKSDLESTSNIDAAKAVGTAIAKAALEKGYEQVVFDRGGYIYHGRVQNLADAAREAGLKF